MNIITKFLYFCFAEWAWFGVGTFCGGASFLVSLDNKRGAAGYGAITAGLT